MSKKRRILVVTSNRSDFNYVLPVIRSVKKHKDLELKVLVTGGHHDNNDYTRKEIIKTGTKIDYDMICYSEDKKPEDYFYWLIDTAEMMYNSLDLIKPDIVVIIGDRVEIFGVAIACCLKGIPISHLQGGDTSGGHDDMFRDMITRMSYLHFPATERSARNVEMIMSGVMRRNTEWKEKIR